MTGNSSSQQKYEIFIYFNPRWESRYFIYPGAVALPEVVVALIRADLGDRLLDYFKPGA